MHRPSHAGRERGFALLLVLWALIALSLILTRLLSAGQQEAQLATNLHQAAIAETIADSAVQATIFSLLTKPEASPEGKAQLLTLPGGVALVQLREGAGMINPNVAPAPLLTALLQSCGVGRDETTQLTQAIMDWRSPANDKHPLIDAYRAAGLPYAPQGQAFQSPDEIRLVLGMSRGIADCMVPALSVYADQEMPVLSVAPPIVRAALLRMMRDAGQAVSTAPPDLHGDRVVEITAEGRSRGGRFIRIAVVRLGSNDPATPYRILTWQEGG
ncbi:type II secretion system minor pseudopilin [Acidisoma sp. 7E03]